MDWTVPSTDDRGYSYVENSDSWKTTCAALPCFKALQWPDYDTQIVEDTIDGKDVVIQLWKGYCEQFLGRQDSPGGIGAEVGIYRRMPGRKLPASLDFLPPLVRKLYALAEKAASDELWWPYPELATTLTFELTNPKTGDTFFTAGPEKTYWLCKWMGSDSYDKYKEDEDGKVPTWSANYSLTYTINGKEYTWD